MGALQRSEIDHASRRAPGQVGHKPVDPLSNRAGTGQGSGAACASPTALRLDREIGLSPRQADSLACQGFRRGLRWAAAALALALGLNGIGLCPCAPQPVVAGEPQSCCPHSGGHPDGLPGTGASVKASSVPCCASEMTSGVAARIDERDAMRHTLTVVAAIHVFPADTVVSSTVSASASALSFSSPPRTTVLRI
jgi:hypothetical protein